MALNKFMHSRNIYNTPPNFAKLAENSDEFRAVAKTTAKGKVHIDFKDDTALRTLTRCLLKQDFNLDVHLPPKQLVPTLPLRLNYVLWIEDMVNAFKLKDVVGLDIGCGASCIYPLLAVKQNPEWRMVGIEMNTESIECARKNVKDNHLDEHISIIGNDSQADPLDALEHNEKLTHFAFTMCNPPFFNDDAESEDSDGAPQTTKNKPPNNAKTGISCELKTAGGETEFVKKIIKRSNDLRTNIGIFTTMLGHKSSVNPILQELKANGITNYCTSEFCQGWTKRWGIAWSFRNDCPLRTVPILGQTLPKPPHRFLPSDIDDADLAANKLCRILSELPGGIITNKCKIESGVQFQFVAFSNGWKNQRRKRRQEARDQQNVNDEEENLLDENPAKRILLDNEAGNDVMSVISENKAPPLLHIEVSVQSKTLTELKAIVEVQLVYLNGTSNLNGVYEILQYIQNKWEQK